MKRWFKGLLISIGMFTILPVPFFDWDDGSLSMVIPCLPVAGAAVGGIWYLGAWLLALWQPPVMIYGMLLCLLPLLSTGLIHLDGFMDTMDALLSCRDREERMRILKDPNMGAFGTAAFGILLLMMFCAGVTLAQRQINILLLVFLPIVSRCLAAFVVINTAAVSTTGYVATFKRAPNRRAGLVMLLVAAAVLWLAWYCCGMTALWVLGVLLVAGTAMTMLLVRQFGGISGDLSGCIIVVSELAGLLTMAVI